MPIFRHYFFILAVIAYIPYVLNKVGDRRHPSVNRCLRNTIRLYSTVQSSVVQSVIFVGLRSRRAGGIGRGHSMYVHRDRWSIRILIMMMMMVTRKKLNYILMNAVYRYHWEEIIHSPPRRKINQLQNNFLCSVNLIWYRKSLMLVSWSVLLVDFMYTYKQRKHIFIFMKSENYANVYPAVGYNELQVANTCRLYTGVL